MEMVFGPQTISAAHFIHTCALDSPCQRLHGHNYIVTVKIVGNADMYSCMLIDANVVKKYLDQFDHRTIVAENCICNYQYPEINSNEILAVQNPTTGKVYFIPVSDCVIVDVPATSAEWLSDFIAKGIKALSSNVNIVSVSLEETSKLTVTSTCFNLVGVN